MKKIYIEVSEETYTDAKEVGFFEVTDFVRNEIKEFVRAQLENRNDRNKIR